MITQYVVLVFIVKYEQLDSSLYPNLEIVLSLIIRVENGSKKKQSRFFEEFVLPILKTYKLPAGILFK